MVKKKKGPVVLTILDGWGISKETKGNAIALGKTPVLDKLWQEYPNALLKASGKNVGLPPHQDGNSEAGHMNIGAGRVIEQDSVIISKSINDSTFFRNAAFLSAIKHVKKYHSKIHLMGLLTSEQSAHADPDHLIALLTLLRHSGINEVYLHLFTDGRDSYQYLAVKLINRLNGILTKNEKISTVAGRFYAMDRIKEWARTKIVYDALTQGNGHKASDAQDAVLDAYNRRENDEYIKPTVIYKNGTPTKRISNNDAVIFFNLRSDRVRQLCKAFVQKDFQEFKREKVLKNLSFVTLTDFGPDLPGVLSAYPARIIGNTLPIVLKDIRQLYIAETEKFAHVTYFLNGGYGPIISNEERVMIKSPHIRSYKDKPEMSADKLTDYLVDSIKGSRYDFMLANYANPDMLGHTGDLPASIKAIEKVDECIGRLVNSLLIMNGTLVITADHGNIEEMIDLETGQVDTSHSKNPVPFIVISKTIPKKTKMNNGVLGDIAPTLLNMMGFKKPKEMSNKILCNYQISQ